MLFRNTNELFSFLKEYYLENGGKVDISTFGMYLGISKGKDWSNIYKNQVREFINVVDKKDLRLILGLPAYVECKPNCMDCSKKYNEILERHIDTIKVLKLNCRVHPNLHLKMYRIGDLYISGGINLSASNNVDASFVIMDQEQKIFLRDLFEQIWKESDAAIHKYKLAV